MFATLLAQTSPVRGTDIPWPLVSAVIGGIIFFSFILLLAKRYKRCPSNRVLVIFGKTSSGNAARCIHGGAAFVLPLIQDHAFLSLEPIKIDIPLKGALSMENIRVNVPSVFTVAVGTDLETMQNAAIRLLGLKNEEVEQQAGDIIFGQLRQVIASMKIEDINRDRDKFLQCIQNSLEPELKKIGLVLINVNITDITDESGYIEAIGRKAAAQAVQQAKVDVAEQEKQGQIGVAEAEREKTIQVANATKLREIGTREAMREQAVRIAQLDKEKNVGEQEAAFEKESRIAEANRDKRVRLADADAKAVTGEATALAVTAAARAQLEVKQAEAYQLSETKKREAEAAVQEAQNRAMAKAALADAERIEAERRASVEAPAKAEKAKTIVEAEANAEKAKIEAQAQATAVFVKLEAEARGQYEILAKKGDGLKRIIEACGSSQAAFQMLLLEHLQGLAQTSAQAISNIKFDKVVVWENGGNGQTTNTASFLHNMARVMPPMLQVMRDIGGVEVPEFMARMVDSTGTTKASPSTNGHAEVAEKEDLNPIKAP